MRLRRRCIVAGALAVLTACGTGRSPIDGTVPSAQFPTLQSAIDGLPSGSVVRLLPGILREAVVIDGKSITLLGNPLPFEPSEIHAPSPTDAGVVTLLHEASLEAHDVTLSGGQACVVAPPFPSAVPGQGIPNPGESLCTLKGINLSCVFSGRGIYGSFTRLALTGGSIGDNDGNGLSLGEVGVLALRNVLVHRNGGAGLYLDNRRNPCPTCQHAATTTRIEDNRLGGIDVVGDAVPLLLLNCVIARNGTFGVSLDQAHSAKIQSCLIEDTDSEESSGRWGDGIRVFSSRGVLVKACIVQGNARAGVSGFGCGDSTGGGPFDISVFASRFESNAFSVTFGGYPDCTVGGPGAFRDLGGNYCEDGCAARPLDLGPLDPPSHSP